MIKKTITYTDFNDDLVTEDFYFHIKKSVLLENMDIKEELQELQNRMTAEDRTAENLTEDRTAENLTEDRTAENLTEEEIQLLLDLVKRLIKLSYGIRSEDGKKHRQTPEIWDDFYDSAAYDAILFQMFQEKGKAMEFLGGIMPKDLMEEAEAEMRKQPQDRLPKAKPVENATIEAVESPEETPVTEVTEEDREERIARLKAELAGLDVSDQPQH